MEGSSCSSYGLFSSYNVNACGFRIFCRNLPPLWVFATGHKCFSILPHSANWLTWVTMRLQFHKISRQSKKMFTRNLFTLLCCFWLLVTCVTALLVPPTNLTTIAGNSVTGGYTGDGGLAVAAKLNSPYRSCVNEKGEIFIADTYVPF